MTTRTHDEARQNNPGPRGQAGTHPADDAREGLATGEGTAERNDVADPHPASEENYDQIPHPGGARPPKQPNIGPNTYTNDGKAHPVSKTKGSEPM